MIDEGREGRKRRSFDFAGWVKKEVEVSESKLHIKTMLWQCMRDKGKWNFYEDFSFFFLSYPRTRFEFMWKTSRTKSVYIETLSFATIRQSTAMRKRFAYQKGKASPEEANQKEKKKTWKFQLWIMRRGKFENSSYPASKKKNPSSSSWWIYDEYENWVIRARGKRGGGRRQNEKPFGIFGLMKITRVCPFYFYPCYVDDDNTTVCK